ncbi:MAG: hypothetical protein CL840_02115 [Crocinitomicaceae bacterium]|nr:hypothetical protein [Crocinitomicaceae bacterium]|tara:strand:+ start:5668 stop:6249 length:582 start_codon:yes stop_codon:yes gene_type:complete
MNIAILDDHVLVAQSLAVALESQYYFRVSIFTPKTLDYSELREFDILLLDFDYGSLGNAYDILADIEKEKLKRLKIIMFTTYGEVYTLLICRHELIHGYVNKTASLNQLVLAIDTIADNGFWYQPKYAKEIRRLIALPKSDVLSPREKEIIALHKLKKNKEEIAKTLDISVNTLSNHLRKIYQKLEISSIAQL